MWTFLFIGNHRNTLSSALICFLAKRLCMSKVARCFRRHWAFCVPFSANRNNRSFTWVRSQNTRSKYEMWKLSYSSIHGLFIYSKRARFTCVEGISYSITCDCGQFIFSQSTFRGETLLWNWAAWKESAVEEERGKGSMFPCSILLSHPRFLCLVWCESCETRTTRPWNSVESFHLQL